MNDRDRLLDLLVLSYDNGESPNTYVDSCILESLIYAESIDLRIWLARALAYSDSESIAVSLLRKLSQDKESCVRVEAIDSLSDFVSHESFDALCSASNDEDEMVRAYSAFGIALVGKTIAPQRALRVLLDISETEYSSRVLVNIFEGMYLLGNKEMLTNLINLFDTTDYCVQCAVLRALGEIINCENMYAIKHFIDSLDASILPRAVTDAMQQINTYWQ